MKKSDFKINQVGLKHPLFNDAYHRVLQASWFKFIFLAAIFYVFLNFIFALLYYFSPAEILNVRPDSLWDSFIFSFQTSSTLGYGYFVPQSVTAHSLVILDTMVGIFYVAIITGLAFSKFAIPSAKILFTDKMIITTFDGVPTLMFRVANIRASHIVDAALNVAALLPYTSTEGHELRRFYPLKLVSDNNPSFSMSWTVMHQISEKSPLFGLSLEQLREKQLVIFGSLTGIDNIMCQTIHANHRYTSDQILPAKKFTDILSSSAKHSYVLDISKFHEIES